MEIKIATTALQKALRDVSIVLKSASRLEEAVIQVQVEGNSLKFSARNSSTTLVTDIKFQGDPQNKVTVAVAPSPFMPYVAALSEQYTTLVLSEEALEVTTAVDKATFRLMNAEFFWDFVSDSFDGEATVRADVLQEISEQVSYATLKSAEQALDSFKTAIRLEADGNSLVAMALTGIQMAKIVRPVVAPSPFCMNILVSDFKTLVALVKTTKQELITLHYGKSCIGFGGQVDVDYEIAVSIRLLEDAFPNMSAMFSKEEDTDAIEFNRAVLVSALTKAQLVSKGEGARVFIQFGEESKVTCSSVTNSIEVALPSTETTALISANLDFLLAAVKHAGEGENVILKLYPANRQDRSMVFVRDPEDETQLHIMSLLTTRY